MFYRVVVLFTRAYAVWGGAREIFLLLAFVYAVCTSLTKCIRNRDSDRNCLGRDRGGQRTLYFLYMRGVSFLVHHSLLSLPFPNRKFSSTFLCFLSGIQFGNGCVFNVENDFLWIALVILIFCESREFLSDCAHFFNLN